MSRERTHPGRMLRAELERGPGGGPMVVGAACYSLLSLMRG